jgi:hypothetical protein
MAMAKKKGQLCEDLVIFELWYVITTRHYSIWQVILGPILGQMLQSPIKIKSILEVKQLYSHIKSF